MKSVMDTLVALLLRGKCSDAGFLILYNQIALHFQEEVALGF